MKDLLPLSAAKEERLAKGKEKKEGASKWSQSTSDGICPLPERTQRTHAGPIPWLTFPRNHQETWSRVDTVSPEWQTGSYSSFAANSIIICLVYFSKDIKSCCMIWFLKDISHQLCFSVQYLLLANICMIKCKNDHFPSNVLHIIKHLSVSKTDFFSQWISMTLLALWQRYLDEAEREKMQYAQELKEYQQTEAYQITSAKIQDKRIKKGDNLCDICHVGHCSCMHSHHIPRENGKILPIFYFITFCFASCKKHLQFSLPEDAPSVIISTSSEPSLSKVHITSHPLTVNSASYYFL